MMVICNHINLHITFYGHGYGPKMSTELHGRMKLGACVVPHWPVVFDQSPPPLPVVQLSGLRVQECKLVEDSKESQQLVSLR